MPSFCCVVKCGSRSNRDRVNFYRIPQVLSFKHRTDLNELSALRRQEWLKAIRREDFSDGKIKNARVCSKHFITGKPAELHDKLNPDWIPSVNMGYKDTTISGTTSKTERFERAIKRSKVSRTQEKEVPQVISTDTEFHIEDVLPCNDKNEMTDLTMDELTNIFLRLTLCDDVQRKLSRVVLNYDSLRGDDVKTRYYTGLETFKVFEILGKYITPFIKIHPNTIMSANEQFLLTLIKLRLNLDYKDLAYRFGISPSTASSYFKNVLHIMCLRFQNFIFWPDRSILKKTMPACFKESFHDNTTVIIDCFEIRTQRPAKLVTAAQSWSSYKHSQTVKYLIGITPQGSICFISEGWGGRVSDKFLTENSTFLDNLIPGDVVMADRGFLIKEFVEIFNATVKIPAFTRGKSQLHPLDLEQTRAIAHVRIHVERVIGLIRLKYTICNDTLSIEWLSTGGNEPIVDEVIYVCCALINICPPIVPL